MPGDGIMIDLQYKIHQMSRLLLYTQIKANIKQIIFIVVYVGNMSCSVSYKGLQHDM